METEFVGGSRNKVDGKGRVSIPAKYRRVLQNCDSSYAPGGAPRLYITHGNPKNTYLECWSGDSYDKLMRQIGAMKTGSKEKNLLSYYYKTKCEALTVDDSGRLVLPPELREKMGLADEVSFDGDGEKFLIMSLEAAEQREAAMLAMLDEALGGDPNADLLSLVGEDPLDVEQ